MLPPIGMSLQQELQRAQEEHVALKKEKAALKKEHVVLKKENVALKEDLSNLATMGKTYQQTTVNGRKRKYTMPDIKLNDQVDPHNTKPGYRKKGNKEEIFNGEQRAR